ncbi:MAG: hypothetical protein ACLSEY_17260 [Enterocloster sp.]
MARKVRWKSGYKGPDDDKKKRIRIGVGAGAALAVLIAGAFVVSHFAGTAARDQEGLLRFWVRMRKVAARLRSQRRRNRRKTERLIRKFPLTAQQRMMKERMRRRRSRIFLPMIWRRTRTLR